MKTCKTIPIIQTDSRERYLDEHGDFEDSCICCGRRTTEKLFIHATTDWTAINESTGDIDSEEFESQGFFPIGSNCAKKYDPEFIFKFDSDKFDWINQA